MEIPFDRKIAEGYAKGQSLIEIHPEWKEKFQKLFHEILKGHIKKYLETH